MEKIKAPQQMQNLCRLLSAKKDWKAREWENFILYYSIPIFSTILLPAQLDHWTLFVSSLYILLKDEIPIDELNRADENLLKFVYKAEQMYGIKCATFNLHQMLHICESVLNWGPLWTNSTFAFESANYYLLKSIKCSRGVTQQIVRYINLLHSLFVIEDHVMKKVSDEVSDYCQYILLSKIKNYIKSENVMYFGDGEIKNLDTLNLLESENSKYFEKVTIKGCLYESFKKKKERSNNSFAQLDNKQFIRIVGFVYDEDKKEEILFYNDICTKSYDNNHQYLKIVETISNDIKRTSTNNIERICIYMNIKNQSFICSVPNMLHY